MFFKKTSGFICCLVAAIFWGTTFVAQDVATKTIPPFTFLALRSFVGAFALLLFILWRDAGKKRKGNFEKTDRATWRTLLVGGALCGLFLCAASSLQQFGIGNNAGSPGKDAFITALYIVFVPVLSLFFGKRSAPHVYVSVLVALGGLWLLCMNGTTLGIGDIQLIGCSLIFAGHILVVEIVGARVDAIKLSCVQFFTTGVLALVLMLIFEAPTLSGILEGWWTVLYAGILSSAVAFSLQIVGQQRTSATLASLVFSLESVVAVIASMVALSLYPTKIELLGMLLIFAAITFSQISLPYKSKDHKT